MSTPRQEFDAIVIGAGAAGCTAARLLTEWGHPILLVDRPGQGPPSLAVSIPPSARRILSAVGIAPLVEQSGFQRWRGNTVWWGAAEPRVETFGAGVEGYQVVLAAFNSLLREQAVQSGAVPAAGRVRDVVLPDSGSPAVRALVSVETDEGPLEVSAPLVLDCSGRAGTIARRGFRQADASHHTVALAAVWRAPSGWGIPDNTHTLVAAYADGWAWSIPTAPGVRYFTVMVDPQRTDLARGPSMEVYRTELDKVAPFQPLLARGSVAQGPWGHDASVYGARQYAGPGFVLAGDAASFIDPLSSYGVKKALASAWVAAVAAHTALTAPELADEALGFHDRRERAVYASYRRQAARFADEAARDRPHPFWTVRASAPDDMEAGEVDASTLARDADVLAAFDDLRRRPSVHLSRPPDAGTALRPLIRGNRIALEEHLVIRGLSEPIRFLRGVDLLALTDLAPSHSDVGAMFDAYVRKLPPVVLPDFLGALSLLIARNVLRHETRIDAG